MSIVLHSIDSVEFYVDSATGESGISQTGLGNLCGVSQAAINQLIKGISDKSRISKELPKSLQPLQGKTFTVKANKVGDIVFISEFACACIIEYYTFEARNRTEAAAFAYRKFAQMGIRKWIHDTTGFQSSEFQSSNRFRLPLKPLKIYFRSHFYVQYLNRS